MQKIRNVILCLFCSAVFLLLFSSCAAPRKVCEHCEDTIEDGRNYYILDYRLCEHCYSDAILYLLEDSSGWDILEEYLRDRDTILLTFEDITGIYVLGRMDAYTDFQETGEGLELFEYYDYGYLKKVYGEYAEY